MSGYVLHENATVLCAHAGQARPTVINTRVKVAGNFVVTQPNPYIVSGCSLSSSGTTPPCTTAQWLTASTRVKAGGQPLLLMDSQATCTPTGTPLTIVGTQMRVKGV